MKIAREAIDNSKAVDGGSTDGSKFRTRHSKLFANLPTHKFIGGQIAQYIYTG